MFARNPAQLAHLRCKNKSAFVSFGTMTKTYTITGVLLTFFFAANILRNWEYIKQIKRHLRDNYLNLTMPLWSTFIIGAANVMNMICAYWRSGGFNEVVFFLGLNSVMCTILLVIVGWAHWQNRGKPPLPKRSYLPQPAEKNESPTGLF